MISCYTDSFFYRFQSERNSQCPNITSVSCRISQPVEYYRKFLVGWTMLPVSDNGSKSAYGVGYIVVDS